PVPAARRNPSASLALESMALGVEAMTFSRGNLSDASLRAARRHAGNPCDSSRIALADPGLFHPALLLQPNQTIHGPRMNVSKRGFVAQADSVAAFLIHVQFERHARLAQRCGEVQRILHRHRWVLRG